MDLDPDPGLPPIEISMDPSLPDLVKSTSIWKKRFQKKPLSDDPAVASLDVEYNELAQAWKKFLQDLPPGDSPDFQGRAQSTDDVVAVVRSARAHWSSSSSSSSFACCIPLADQFLVSLNAHVVLLAALLDSDLYISLFCGVLQSLIKASSNYPSPAQTLLKALVDVNEAVSVLVRDCPGFSGGDCLPSVASLYALIFFFLEACIDWYIKMSVCRLLTSHNQDLYDDNHALIDNIQNTARDIARQFADGMDLDRQADEAESCKQTALSHLKQAQWREVGSQGPERRVAAQLTWLRQFIWDIQRDASRRSQLEQARETLLPDLFASVSRQLRAVGGQSGGVVWLKAKPAVPPLEELGLLKDSLEMRQGTRRKLTKVSLLLASKHFQNSYSNEDQIAHTDPGSVIALPDNILPSFQDWATTGTSQIHVVGQRQSSTPTGSVAIVSATYAGFARQAGLPVISHFCSLPSQCGEGKSPFEAGLIALAYSLLRQLFEHVPPLLDCDVESQIKADRLDMLRGTLASWKELLSAIDTVLHFMPPLLICVIDGLDVLHDPSSTDQHIRSLLRILFRHARYPPVIPMYDGTQKSVLFKGLITVSGQPGWLMESLAENQAVPDDFKAANQQVKLDRVMASDTWAVTMST